jgi:hypothetical protein
MIYSYSNQFKHDLMFIELESAVLINLQYD